MNKISKAASHALVATLLASLAACGGGGGGSDNPNGGNPPAPVPNPPPPPPPPPPAVNVPPLSPTVQDITDGHQVGVDRWGNPQTDGSAIGNFTCGLNPPQTFELYAHLSILVNNEPQAIPNRLGASPQGMTHCFYTIHTHDESGKIHVTPTAAGTFTLGDLFQIWGQPLTSSNVAGISGLPVEVYVTDNGTVTPVAEADWSSIELKSHREITISLGTSPTEIPNFTWTD
ncbi:MAG TPA: hypothetical protein VFL16_14560 [Steroidobacteraceae bacterium]|jgi:hypothetical protein|nr:hypothetical protein [Steroidobacteraceae bacterium]